MQEAAAGWQETSEPGAIREMPLEELHSGLQALSALSGTASRAPREPHFLLRAAPYTLAEGIGLHPSASGDGGRRWGQAGEGRYFSPVPPLLSSRLAAPEFLCQEAHAPGRKAPSPGVSSGEGTALSSSWRPLFPGRSLEKRIVLAVGFLLLSHVSTESLTERSPEGPWCASAPTAVPAGPPAEAGAQRSGGLSASVGTPAGSSPRGPKPQRRKASRTALN